MKIEHFSIIFIVVITVLMAIPQLSGVEQPPDCTRNNAVELVKGDRQIRELCSATEREGLSGCELTIRGRDSSSYEQSLNTKWVVMASQHSSTAAAGKHQISASAPATLDGATLHGATLHISNSCQVVARAATPASTTQVKAEKLPASSAKARRSS